MSLSVKFIIPSHFQYNNDKITHFNYKYINFIHKGKQTHIMSKQKEFNEFKIALKKRAAKDLGKALNCLENNISDYSDYYNTIIWQIGRFNQVEKDFIRGTISISDRNLILNRLREGFTKFVDELEPYDFDSLDISKSELIDLGFKRKTKELKKNIQKIEQKNWATYLMLSIPILIVSALGGWFYGNYYNKTESPNKNKTEKIDTEAETYTSTKLEHSFNKLFQDGQIFPYSIGNTLPCSAYEGKWELDNSKPYVLSIPVAGEGVFYYRAKDLHFYLWCDKKESNGSKLKGVELFTNELWKYSKDEELDIAVDSTNYISEKNGFTKIAEISSLFMDEIYLDNNGDNWKPSSRKGEKVIRYTPTIISKDESH